MEQPPKKPPMRADRQKTDLLAAVSHDIRTPMNSLMGVLQLLLQTELSDTQRRYVQLAQSSGEQMLGLLQHHLDAPPTATSTETQKNGQHAIPPNQRNASVASGLTSQGLRILLADDHPVNQQVTQAMLNQLGHTVVLADNGQQALDWLQQATFDLLILDVTMPQMDGLQVLAAIRKDEARSGLHQPVVMLTGHAMQGDEERFLALGADAYVSKPIAVQALKSVLAGLIPVTPIEAAPKPLGISPP
jgi:CheY-like chemotaxis protein